MEIKDFPLVEASKKTCTISDLVPKFLSQSNSLDELKIPLQSMKANLPIIDEIGKILDQSKTLTYKQKSILNLFLYLSLTEGLFSELVNIIAYMHIHSQDKFVYLEGDTETERIAPLYSKNDCEKKKPLNNYNQIRKEDLFYRLSYIGNYSTQSGETLSKLVDTHLRNCIAHLNYSVNDDGTVIFGKEGKKVNSEQEIRFLMKNIFMLSYELQPLVQTILH
jgi:hypothetical protein